MVTSPGNYTADLGPHSEAAVRERMRRSLTGLGLCFSGQSGRPAEISETKEPLAVQSLALHPVEWLARCLFEIAVFEVHGSLKWMMPGQWKLRAGTHITKKKKKTTVRAYTTVMY